MQNGDWTKPLYANDSQSQKQQGHSQSADLCQLDVSGPDRESGSGTCNV